MRELSGNLYFDALEFATKAHQGQTRKNGTVAYISHPIRVALLIMRYTTNDFLKSTGVSIDELLAAAMLHDTKEDCGVTHEQLTQLFGKTVSDLVDGVTSCSTTIKKVGKKTYLINKMIKMSKPELMLKLCDRLANVTDTPKPKYISDTLETVKMLKESRKDILDFNTVLDEIVQQCHYLQNKLCQEQLEKVY